MHIFGRIYLPAPGGRPKARRLSFPRSARDYFGAHRGHLEPNAPHGFDGPVWDLRTSKDRRLSRSPAIWRVLSPTSRGGHVWQASTGWPENATGDPTILRRVRRAGQESGSRVRNCRTLAKALRMNLIQRKILGCGYTSECPKDPSCIGNGQDVHSCGGALYCRGCYA
jgi:hypothetical protein